MLLRLSIAGEKLKAGSRQISRTPGRVRAKRIWLVANRRAPDSAVEASVVVFTEPSRSRAQSERADYVIVGPMTSSFKSLAASGAGLCAVPLEWVGIGKNAAERLGCQTCAASSYHGGHATIPPACSVWHLPTRGEEREWRRPRWHRGSVRAGRTSSRSAPGERMDGRDRAEGWPVLEDVDGALALTLWRALRVVDVDTPPERRGSKQKPRAGTANQAHRTHEALFRQLQSFLHWRTATPATPGRARRSSRQVSCVTAERVWLSHHSSTP